MFFFLFRSRATSTPQSILFGPCSWHVSPPTLTSATACTSEWCLFARATKTLSPPFSSASRECASGLPIKMRHSCFARAGGRRCFCQAAASPHSQQIVYSVSVNILFFFLFILFFFLYIFFDDFTMCIPRQLHHCVCLRPHSKFGVGVVFPNVLHFKRS